MLGLELCAFLMLKDSHDGACACVRAVPVHASKDVLLPASFVCWGWVVERPWAASNFTELASGSVIGDSLT